MEKGTANLSEGAPNRRHFSGPSALQENPLSQILLLQINFHVSADVKGASTSAVKTCRFIADCWIVVWARVDGRRPSTSLL